MVEEAIDVIHGAWKYNRWLRYIFIDTAQKLMTGNMPSDAPAVTEVLTDNDPQYWNMLRTIQERVGAGAYNW